MSVEKYADLIAQQGIDPDELRICNCATCDAEILGESQHGWYLRMLDEGKQMLHIPRPGLRIGGRPYCYPCGQSVHARAAEVARKVSVACDSNG